MIPPPTPAGESERLRALRALALLDTAPEERFDRVTRLAQRMFGVPIALVSLIDADRQWFKSRQGLDASETSREHSFCGHAIEGDAVFTVDDARQDTRFHDNPLVDGNPGIRFYAGCPIKGPSGARLGTLCVIDREPRRLSEAESAMLVDLAAVIEAEVAAADLATVDELTGLANRRGFEVVAGQVMAICHRRDQPVSVLFADLDGLKRVNDALGHEAGDALIGEFGDLLAQTYRRSDVVARLGGDEFVVFFAGSEDTETLRQHLAAAVDARNRSVDGPRLEYSAGAVTSSPTSGESVNDVLARADAAMYEHKRRER